MAGEGRKEGRKEGRRKKGGKEGIKGGKDGRKENNNIIKQDIEIAMKFEAKETRNRD